MHRGLLADPKWGADMAAAARAQALLQVYDLRTVDPEAEPPPEADPTLIVVVIRP